MTEKILLEMSVELETDIDNMSKEAHNDAEQNMFSEKIINSIR